MSGVWWVVYDEWCLMSGVWWVVYDEWCLMSGVWPVVYDEWCMMSGVWWVVYDEWCMMSSVWWVVYDEWYMMSGVWWVVYDEWCMTSGVWWVVYDEWWLNSCWMSVTRKFCTLNFLWWVFLSISFKVGGFVSRWDDPSKLSRCHKRLCLVTIILTLKGHELGLGGGDVTYMCIYLQPLLGMIDIIEPCHWLMFQFLGRPSLLQSDVKPGPENGL